MLNNDAAKLRFDFIELVFALAIGQVGVEVGDFVSKGYDICLYPTFFTHLALAVYIIAGSWIGWLNSASKGSSESLKTPFTMSFLILLLDLVLVICYFILVKDAEKKAPPMEKAARDGSMELNLVEIIFWIYFFWDIISKLFPQDEDFKISFDLNSYLKRAYQTWLCLIIVYFLVSPLAHEDSTHQVECTDVALICTFVLFRSLKAYSKLDKLIDKLVSPTNPNAKPIEGTPLPSKRHRYFWMIFPAVIIITIYIIEVYL